MIELHYWPTPNGHKVTLLLEELAEAGAPLQYRIVPVDIGKGAQFEPDYLKISPNNKMPAIVDHDPEGGGGPLSVFESGAILMHLAERFGEQDWFEVGDRCQSARSPDLHANAQQLRSCLSRGIFVCDRPTRGFSCRAELLL